MFFAYFRQFLGSGTAIALGVALAAAVSVIASTVGTSIRAYDYQNNDRYDLIAENVSQDSATDVAAIAQQVSGVSSATTRSTVSGAIRSKDLFLRVPFATLPGPLSDTQLLAGKLPTSPDEVALTPEHADLFKASVGDRFTISLPQKSTAADAPARANQLPPGVSPKSAESTVTVTGLVAKYHPMDVRGDVAVMVGGFAPTVWAEREPTTKVVLQNGTDRNKTQRSLQAALGSNYLVNTGLDWAESQRTYAKEAQAITTVILGVFAVICLVVMGMVVGNGFLITLARRSQELALQRCLGSTRGQIIGQVMLQTLVLSILFAALGGLAGALSTYYILRWVNVGFPALPLILPTVQVWNVIAAATAGVALACASAWMPAVKASLGSPVVAMEPPTPISEQKTVTGWTLVYGLSAFLSGAALLMWAPIFEGIWPIRAIIILCGAIATYFGWTVCNVAIVPALLRAWGFLLTRLLGFPGELAVRNTIRNTGRAVAMISTLMVGVVLTVTVSCVGAVALASINVQTQQSQGPSFGAAINPDTPFTPQILAQLGEVRGVESVSTFNGFAIRTKDAKNQMPPVPDGAPADVQRPKPQPPLAATVFSTDLPKHLQASVSNVEPGTIVVTPRVASSYALTAGEPTAFRVGSQETVLKVKVVSGESESLMFRSHPSFGAYLNATDVSKLKPQMVPVVAVFRFAQGADSAKTGETISNILSTETGVTVSSSDNEVQQIARTVGYVRWAIIGLLSLAIFIAMVGMASTISLAVKERRLESSLLRALGVTSGQVRVMYIVETLIFSLSATTAGTLLGLWYGWAGSRMLSASSPDLFAAEHIQLSMVPWGQTLVLNTIVAMLSLVLTLVPVWQAGRVAPAEGLAAS